MNLALSLVRFRKCGCNWDPLGLVSKSDIMKSMFKNVDLFFWGGVFLVPHTWHMEVPSLGVESELQLPAYTTVTAMRDRIQAATET